MPDQKTLDVYAAKADDYVSCVKGEGGRNIRQFIERLKPGGTVLDIGCGPGQASAQLAKAGMQVTAIDPVPEMIAFAKQNPGVDARVGTFDDIDGDEIYDGVWANFCLLHADRKDIPRHIAAIARALKPEGVFHIGMITGTGAHRDDIGRLY
ncbi:MAG: class I SAM-dependent methyltransferase, partial [Rhodobacteraceae bacterium]|nr:class I SAM-dependent methyltransferase [Paracoccaceae bacterium]